VLFCEWRVLSVCLCVLCVITVSFIINLFQPLMMTCFIPVVCVGASVYTGPIAVVVWGKCQSWHWTIKPFVTWHDTHGSPTAAKLGNPALCGRHPLLTPYYCRLGDLLCFCVFTYCIFVLFVYSLCHIHSYSFRTAFVDLNLYWTKGPLLFVLVSGYVC